MPTKPRPAKSTTKKSESSRQPKRKNVKLLTSFRSLEPTTVEQTGFVRAVKLSVADTTLESPDPFVVGQKLALEFLLDNDRLANVTGKVTRVAKRGVFYLAEVAFDKPPAQVQRWINDQIK